MKLHPRIEELYKVLQKATDGEVITSAAIKHLIDYGVTQTEALITLRLGFNMTWDMAESLLNNINGFKYETSNDSLYFTVTYMYYDN